MAATAAAAAIDPISSQHASPQLAAETAVATAAPTDEDVGGSAGASESKSPSPSPPPVAAPAPAPAPAPKKQPSKLCRVLRRHRKGGGTKSKKATNGGASPTATSASQQQHMSAVVYGWMWKQGKSHASRFKRRYFVLRSTVQDIVVTAQASAVDTAQLQVRRGSLCFPGGSAAKSHDRSTLSYYKGCTSDGVPKGKELGQINLMEVNVMQTVAASLKFPRLRIKVRNYLKHGFELHTEGRRWVMLPESDLERVRWATTLRRVMRGDVQLCPLMRTRILPAGRNSIDFSVTDTHGVVARLKATDELLLKRVKSMEEAVSATRKKLGHVKSTESTLREEQMRLLDDVHTGAAVASSGGGGGGAGGAAMSFDPPPQLLSKELLEAVAPHSSQDDSYHNSTSGCAGCGCAIM